MNLFIEGKKKWPATPGDCEMRLNFISRCTRSSRNFVKIAGIVLILILILLILFFCVWNDGCYDWTGTHHSCAAISDTESHNECVARNNQVYNDVLNSTPTPIPTPVHCGYNSYSDMKSSLLAQNPNFHIGYDNCVSCNGAEYCSNLTFTKGASETYMTYLGVLGITDARQFNVTKSFSIFGPVHDRNSLGYSVIGDKMDGNYMSIPQEEWEAMTYEEKLQAENDWVDTVADHHIEYGSRIFFNWDPPTKLDDPDWGSWTGIEWKMFTDRGFTPDKNKTLLNSKEQNESVWVTEMTISTRQEAQIITVGGFSLSPEN